MKTLIAISLLTVLTACGEGAGSATDQAIAEAITQKTAEPSEKTGPVAAETTDEKSVVSEAPAPEAEPLSQPLSRRTASVQAPAIVEDAVAPVSQAVTPSAPQVAMKLVDSGCVDPDLTKVMSGVQLTLCDGSTGTGSYVAPAPTVTVIDNTVTYAQCSSNGETGCLSNTNYKAADLSALNASNIKQGVSIAGVTGSYAPAAPQAGQSVADCTSDLEVGCKTTLTYKAVDVTNLTAGSIKSGVTIAGITGQFPSTSYPLTGTNVADLDAATFQAKVKSSTAFEWFGADGVRHQATGTDNLLAANIKKDLVIFGVTGTLEATAPVAPNAWDIRAGKTVNGVAGKMKHCFNGDVSQTGENKCSNDIQDVSDINANAGYTCAANPDKCMRFDPNTNKIWSPVLVTNRTYSQAVSYCNSLNYGGFSSGWRLPKVHELATAKEHFLVSWGMLDAAINATKSTITATLGAANGTVQVMDHNAVITTMATTTAGGVMCVRYAN